MGKILILRSATYTPPASNGNNNNNNTNNPTPNPSTPGNTQPEQPQDGTWIDGFHLATDGSFVDTGEGWCTTGILNTQIGKQYTLNVPGYTGSTRIIFFDAAGAKTGSDTIPFNTPYTISSAKFAINIAATGASPGTTFDAVESVAFIMNSVTLTCA